MINFPSFELKLQTISASIRATAAILSRNVRPKRKRCAPSLISLVLRQNFDVDDFLRNRVLFSARTFVHSLSNPVS